MENDAVKIFPLGENALTVNFDNEISPELNDKVLSLARYFTENAFPGFIEIFPAYASLSIFYDVWIVRKNLPEFTTAFEAVKFLAENALRNLDETLPQDSRLIEIPVDFTAEFAPDLMSIAAERNLLKEQFIKIFTARSYRVYMLGFLPGFAYMGEVDERIAAPRKSSPRAQVSKGSVGIAGRQTGIYSLASPGGWQIIGKTNVELFTPEGKTPTFLQAGDEVRFYDSNL